MLDSLKSRLPKPGQKDGEGPSKKFASESFHKKIYTVSINDPAANSLVNFPSNRISTTKYTPWTFFPRNLYEQFKKVYNLYFLIVVLAMFIPGATPFSPVVNIIPLIIVLSITGIKDALEDVRRYREDRVTNYKEYFIFPRHLPTPDEKLQLLSCRAQDLQVGDIVQIKRGQFVPADIVMLATSDPRGVCYIETGNLDGESNLKQMQTLSWTNLRFRTLEGLKYCKGKLSCELPNNLLYNFTGRVAIAPVPSMASARSLPSSHQNSSNLTGDHNQSSSNVHAPPVLNGNVGHDLGAHDEDPEPGHAQEGTSSSHSHPEIPPLKVAQAQMAALRRTSNPTSDLPSGHISHHRPVSAYHEAALNESQLLLRGVRVRNTKWVYGVVVYTGKNTKLSRNNKQRPPSKYGHLDREMNRYILVIFVIQIIICIVCGVMAGEWQKINGVKNWYLGFSTTEQVGLETLPATAMTGLLGSVTYFVLLARMIPTALIVSAELVRALSVKFMEWDVKMRTDPSKPETAMKVKDSNLNDELGRIEYLFADKTGTLTENKMVFSKCCVGGTCHEETSAAPGNLFRAVAMHPSLISSPSQDTKSLHPMSEFLLMMAVCNTVVPEGADADNEEDDETEDIDDEVENGFDGGGGTKMLDMTGDQPSFIPPAPPLQCAELTECSNGVGGDQRDPTMTSRPLVSPRMSARAMISPTVLAVYPNEVTVTPNEEPFYALSNHDSGQPLQPRTPSSLLSHSSSSPGPLNSSAIEAVNVNVIHPLNNMAVLAMHQPGGPIRQMKTSSRTSLAPLTNGRDAHALNRQPSHLSQHSFSPSSSSSSDATVAKIIPLNEPMSHTASGSTAVLITRKADSERPCNADGVTLPLRRHQRHASQDLRAYGYGSEHANLVYTGQSPDEVALCKAARANGVTLTDRSSDFVTIADHGTASTNKYQLLTSVKFTSERKRMSVIVRGPDGTIRLWTKGSDDEIYKRLAPNQTDPAAKEVVQHALRRYSTDGLRTLVFASRVLSEEDFNEWHYNYQAAESCLDERRKMLLDDLCDSIERELQLVGASAVEDRLQAHVPETIDFLQKAGVVVWVLTGDMQETAINIANSSKLLRKGMELIKVNVSTVEECSSRLASILDEQQGEGNSSPRGASSMMPHHHKHKSRGNRSVAPSKTAAPTLDGTHGGRAVIIDGRSLGFVLEHDDNMNKFLAVARTCTSVICCRVSPLQKARVVSMVKQKLRKICLAIGDGANDVGMIQEAHVGVGIMGNEGAQAAQAADYNISRFYHLRRLLAVHGRWNYIRMAAVVHTIFYKDVLFTLPQLWYSIYNGVTGVPLFSDWVIAGFDVVFTALPPIVLGVMEKDLEDHICESNPEAYYHLRKDDDTFNWRTLGSWYFAAIAHSLVVFFFVLQAVLYGGEFTTEMFPLGRLFWGTMLCVAVMLVIVLKFMLHACSWNIIFLLSCAFSFLSFLVWIIIESYLPAIEPVMDSVVPILARNPATYFTVVLVVIACLVPDYTLRYVQRNYLPSYANILQAYDILYSRGKGGWEPKHQERPHKSVSSSRTEMPAP
mmetsp:Transcript_16351/g.27006  ORF Transcript_16351/g.27006 Transcript_16351/m.27006 type:complete len:1552 (+) Transcript_16351:172-4827(+)|eukprot:CAMPEP_0184654918 /NCGR_PEP_ID=MMETSP0308-20130426/12576_1 /TAXON_ID=38269 /ORGANISM="Gloeochaete witrockiana, Strain SAG 46.84" /LENGTH=1551 /DNA_ID=CAMNT_0027091131 /DNA_START=106 /DNA_END=4761 /DNA_ORIENTATION=+